MSLAAQRFLSSRRAVQQRTSLLYTRPRRSSDRYRPVVAARVQESWCQKLVSATSYGDDRLCSRGIGCEIGRSARSAAN